MDVALFVETARHNPPPMGRNSLPIVVQVPQTSVEVFSPVLAEGDAGCLKFALQRFVDQAPCVKVDDVVHVRTVLESRCSRITAMLTMHLKLM